MITRQDNNLLLHILIQPKASRDKIVGLHGDEIKVAITAPPVDGQANQHLIQFLAKQFKVSKGSVTLLKGQQSRHKLVQIESPKLIPAEIASLIE